MNARSILATVSAGASLAACIVAAYVWGAGAATLAAVSASAAFLAARLFSRSRAVSQAYASVEAKAQEDSTSSSTKRAVARREPRVGALLEETLDGMREGVLVIDGAMRVVTSNKSAREIFSADEAKGFKSARLLSEMTRNPIVYKAFAGAVERGRRAEAKVEADYKGERRIYNLQVAPLRESAAIDDRDSRGAVGILFDVTQLERLERVRQEFLSNVSHELRTPLTAILAYVESLEDGALEDVETAERFLSVIRRNSERMRDLINDILELSAIEAGTVEVETDSLRLSALIEDCFAALASRATERGVELRNETPSDVYVYADARRLEQMLTNLIDNAIKFNREGGSVTVSHERGERRDRISVADTGEGLLPEHVARIFERFYRVDRARSRALGGTGLGLAIVKHLARAHGGEVTVRSTFGEGATFTVELPAR